MKNRIFSLLVLLLLLILPASAFAQSYSFSLDQVVVHVFWNEDGTSSIDYVFIFSNDPGASPIDFVDVGLPNPNFDENSISADVNGKPVDYVSESEYQGSGNAGVAVALGNNAIQPGETGMVHVYIGTVGNVLYPDSTDDNYASAVFAPTYFGSQFVHGNTDVTVVFHLPPGVQPDEPRWHESPSGWPNAPITGIDDQGRITYTWENPQANGYTQYLFGASFPQEYVPESAVVRPSLWESFWGFLGIDPDDLIGFGFCCCIGVFILGSMALSIRSAQKRKLQYLPPKISIEGHGIKRGLTSVEAAILMEQPMDKIMTMILFSVVKKAAATVTTREPLQLEIASPLPEGLRQYESDFLDAFSKSKTSARRNALQEMMIGLVKSVSKKMKGFSRKETVAYYKKIIEKAWAQVEAADTPEVKSEQYDKYMGWTMLDREYDERTRRVFHGGPVFVPIWWPRYDPSFGRGASAPRTTSTPSSGGGRVSMPTLPGSAFAGTVVAGVQDFSSGVIGNVTDFTSKITNKTNPVPKSTSSGKSYGGGGGCACACACAGCACACAGGGR